MWVHPWCWQDIFNESHTVNPVQGSVYRTSLCTVRCNVHYTVHCTVHWTVHCTVRCTVHRTVYYTVHWTLSCNLHCTAYCICIMTKGGIYMKYILSTREIPRSEPEGFPEGSVHISPYILTIFNFCFFLGGGILFTITNTNYNWSIHTSGTHSHQCTMQKSLYK